MIAPTLSAEVSSAADLMRRRAHPLQLVIFDCDGVIVDSEPVSNAVLAADLSLRGWHMTADHAEHLFIGTAIASIQRQAEAAIGEKLPPDWQVQIRAAIVAALAREAVAMPGAIVTLKAVAEMGLPWRIASNSSHDEMRVKFDRIGISDLVRGRVHSYEDVARGKPAPDLFLAAAAAEGVAASACVVIEDSVPGVTAAVAAGMDCLGFDRSADGAFLRAAGAAPFHDMAHVPALLALAPRQAVP